MGYTVILKDTKTNKTSKNHYDFPWTNDFWWSEGNMSCDCNRFLEFERGLGKNPDGEKAECGEGRYKIVSIISDKGKKLYKEVE